MQCSCRRLVGIGDIVQAVFFFRLCNYGDIIRHIILCDGIYTREAHLLFRQTCDDKSPRIGRANHLCCCLTIFIVDMQRHAVRTTAINVPVILPVYNTTYDDISLAGGVGYVKGNSSGFLVRLSFNALSIAFNCIFYK